jgi:hypothetical protein
MTMKHGKKSDLAGRDPNCEMRKLVVILMNERFVEGMGIC